MSLGNRVISLVLALVMVIGMMPAGVLSVFAADTTGNPDVTSNADTILQYAQGKLNDNHDKTGAFTWDTEGKSDGWRYFNGVMLEAFLQNGLQASETETAYSFAQNYFGHYINASGSSYNDVLNGEYSTGHKELDGVPPARNLAQLVGHVGFTDDKYANAVKVLYTNTVGQKVVSNTGGNFIHKEDNDNWEGWQVGLDGIYMAQPFLMEVAKAVKEGRVDVGATHTAIADGVYNRLYWVANNMKYQTSDNVYLYHHGWGPGDDYKNGNGVTWSRGTGWWVAGLADCIALMEDIGYDSAKITTLKGYLKEAIDGLLEYQDDSGLWYNVIYVKGSGTTTSNNFLETSGTGLFAYTIMKAYTRGWLTDAKYGSAAIKAIDGIMGSSTYYSSSNGFQNILKSSGVGTTVSYYNSDKSANEAKGVGPIIMAASMYDDVKAMVSGGSKYTETFQIGAVNITELPVMDGVVSANGLKATVVGSKGTIKDVTDLSATELSTELDGDKVKVLYNGNLIATVDAKIISTDAISGTGSFTVASSATDPSTGTNHAASGTVTVAGSESGGSEKVYTLYSSADKTSVPAGNYVIVYSTDLGSGKALTGYAEEKGSGTVPASPTDVTISGDKITVGASSLTVWTVASNGSIKNGKNYLQKGDSDKLLKNSEVTGMVFSKDGTNGAWMLALRENYYLIYNNGNFHRSAETKTGAGGYNIYLFAEETVIIPTEDVDYTITLTAGSDGELMNKGDTKTLTATLTAAAGETIATPTGSIVWASTNSNVASVDSNGKVTAVAAGDATITATVTGATVSGSEESVNLSVEIPVTVTEAATYSVTLTLEPGSIVGKVGETGSFTPVVVIKDASGNDVTSTFADSIEYNGTIADTSIATVANDGTISYVKAGYTTFTQTATVNGTTVTATGNILVQAEEAEHIHSYTAREEITQAATCTATGSKKVYCSCGEYEVKTISATGHSWNAGEVTKNATCNEAGTKTFTCTACSATKTETIAATGNHTYVNGACSVCGTSDPGYVAPGIESIVAGSNTTGKATIKAGNTLQLTANVTGGASVTWSSSSDAIATVSDSGLVTGVSAGTVTITATVVTASRAVGDTATFEVTVTEASTNPGNISTTETTGGTADSTAPSRAESGYMEIVAPSTSTTGGTSTEYDVFNGSSNSTKTFISYSDSSYGNESVTYTLPDGTSATTGAPKKMNSNTEIKFTADASGALKLYFSTNSSGESIYLDSTSYTIPSNGILEITDVAKGSHIIKKNSGESQLGYIQFTSGSGGTETTVPGEYAKLVGTQGYAFAIDESIKSDVRITAIKADTSATAFKIMVSENADGTGATELENGLNNSRVTISKNSSGPSFSHTTANTYYFGVYVDGIKIGEIPVKLYDPDATTGGTTTTTWYNGTLALDPTSVSMTVGDADKNIADTLTAVAVEGGASATINSFTTTWESSNTSVATVDSNGNVHAVGAGTATITAKLTAVTVNGATGTIHEEIKATATVTVTASGSDTPSSGNIYTHNFSTNKDGQSDTDKYFTISGSFDTGSVTVAGVTYNQGLKLESSNGTVTFTAANAGTLTLHVGSKITTVKIDNVAYTVSNGVVTVDLAAGTHVIAKGNGSDNLYYVEYAEENVEPEYSVTISGNDMLLGGDSTTLTAEMFLGEDAVDGATYEWTVTGAEIYSINGNAVTVKASNASGDITVSVKATYGENTAEASKTVTISPVSASISGADSVYVDDSATYTVAVSPSGSTYNVAWSVTNGTGSATIDAATGVLTGVTAGDVTVTATITGIAGTSIGATASKTVTVKDNTYTVTFQDTGINEGVTANLSNYISVTKNGATMTSGYTLVFTVDGAANDGSYTGEAVDANATHNVVVSLKIGDSVVATDEGTLTVYDTNFHDTNLWSTQQTDTATVVEGGKLIFTLSGNLAAGYWGFLDNLKLYKEDGTEVSITNGDFESGITGWTVTGFSSTPVSDSKAEANKTNRLNLWISNTDAATGTATFTVTGLDAGNYYFKYDILNGTEGSTVTGTATATEVVKSNVTVTTGGVTGEAGTYNLVTSLQTNTPYVFKSEGSSHRNPTVTEDSNGKLSFTSSVSYETWTQNDDGTYTPANTTPPTFWYIDADGHLYTLNSKGVKYYVQDGLTSLGTEPGTYVWSLETNSNNTYLKITNDDGTKYARAKSDCMESKDGYSKAGVVLAYTPSVTSGEQTTTEYLVEAIPQNLTVEAGSTVDPAITLTGKDMEGNTVTVTGTLSYVSANTGIATVEDGKIKGVSAGSTTVTATLTDVKIDGKTGAINEGATISATFNVTVTPAPVSKDEWIHNVTTDGVTDADGFYDISKGSGNAGTSDTSRTYGDLSFDTAIKMESSTEIAFTAPNDGTFTMVFRTSDKGKGIKINGTSYPIGEDGVLTIDVEKGTEYTITKNDSVVVFYLEYASALVDGLTLTEPGTIYMYVKDASSSAATHVMEYVVRHGEADVTSSSSAYTIAWSSDNESVATVSGGTISGIKPGTANITATVTMSDGTQYTATVPVKVEGATIGTTDELNLMVDVDDKKTGTIGSNVHAAGASTDEFTVGYLSSDTSVATVDENGVVTAKGVGTATIYTYLTSVNGHTVYSGTPTVDTLPEQYATTAVTVTQREITDAHLNTYDYVVQKNNTGDKSALYELLEYKEDVVGSVHGEEGVKLTITYNTNETIVAEFVDADHDGIDDNYEDYGYGLQIDLDSIDMTKTGIQIAVVTYTDAKGNELFRDSIWIHVEEYDPADYDGTMIYEGNIRYELDTDGIEPNEEYVIVADRDTAKGTGVAFMNPDTQSQASSTASGNSVVVKTENSKEIITIASGADATVWLFDTYNLNVPCPDGKARTQLNASNSQRYVGPGEAETQLIHGNVAHVYLETVDEATGVYYIILGFNDNNQPYYLAYGDGTWHATTTPSTVYLYNKHADIQDYGVNYDLYDKDNAAEIETAELIEGKTYDKLNPVITWGGSNTAAESYTIVWSSSNPSVATVDQNGKVTALKEGTATITATLYDVNGFDVICNTHDTPYMTQAVTVNVITDNATPTLTPSYLEIGQGSMPNLEKVNIEMSYGEGSENNYFIDHNLLNFRMADATNSAGEVVGFDSTTIDTYTVPVDYAGKTYNLTIKVVEDPYAGLEPADSIPGYPDAGSVRMDKIAEAVLDFTTTGVTKIELTAAGVSTKNSVDVILIVDVSNSMSWDINNSSNTTDAKRIPTDGVDGTTKLDTAMDVADSFAKILLTVPGGDNTITFVTFAGADRQHGGSNDNVDSVRTPMVGVSNYDTASAVFGATEFTALTVNGDSVKCTLNIGGYTGNGYGEAAVSGTNRGNTNYDFAFGQAIDAVADLKALYKAETGKEYDDSGRQIQVVFMTDGAPSHYNNKKANGSSDSLWSGSGTYGQLSGVTTKKASDASESEKTNSMATWLTYMKNYNELATDLYALADGFYVVGFDMDAGGFSFFQWGVADMTRVLEGLVKNTALPVETADDNAALTTYFTNLAKALAHPGTNAKVTDQIGSNFTLFTGAHMYSDDITEPYVDENGETKQIMSKEVYNQMNASSFPITVASYRLVTAADVEAGESLTMILTDGSTYTGVPTKEHLGLRVAGEDNVDILETITFSADGTQAYSSVLGSDNIMIDDLDKMIRTIDASTFTYTATISPIKDAAGNVTGYHADQENIIWKLNTIEDHELSMSYYAYLEGSLDNPREAVAGSYATNEYAYLEYIDVYGKYVKRDYGVPQIAWGAGSVTVRFFLVNAKGEYVNRAGVVFTNPANRIFLDGRAQYEAELNNSVSFTAADALLQAGLAGSNILYDVNAGATVTNSTALEQGGVSWIKNSNLTNIDNLLTYTDSSNGYFTSVVIDIPVVMTELGESDQKMGDSTVVIDYSNCVQWDALVAEERAYDGVIYNGVQYNIELVGFAKYNSAADLKDYVQQANWPTTYSTDYGTYELGNGGDDYIKFTPKAMLSGTDHVFAVFKFENLDKDKIGENGENMEFYYMYKQVNVVPATVVHYETTGNMGAAFQSNANGAAWGIESVTGNAAGDSQSNANAGYGYDDSYNNCVNFAGGSSLYVENTDSKATRPSVKFTFTGTGIDIISKTDPDQGRIKMTLTGKNTGTKKTAMVLNKGVDNLYQIPVLSIEGLPYDTYEVEIVVYSKTSAYGGKFYFDAINVYGSAQESEVIGSNTTGDITVGDMYVAAGESKPQILEIRDILLGNNNFGDISVEGVNGAVYIDGNTSLGDTSTNFNNYDKIGPNNEVYLSNNQAVAFKLRVEDLAKLPTTLDIGLKSVNGTAAKAVIYVYKSGVSDTTPAEYTVTTATAMFYDILGGENIKTFLGDSNEFYVVITNKAAGTLSVTDLKVGYGAAKGNVETVVDITVGNLTQDTLKQSAQVVSVAIANMDTTTDPDTAVAYAMYTTTIVVVTGQDAQRIEVLDSQGNAIAVNASYVDSENGARRWRVLVRFDEVGTDTYTVYGVGTDGSRHDTYQEITVDVRLFAPATTTN